MRRQLPPVFRALGNHNYRLWASADLVSVTGTWMQVLGLNWVVLAMTGSATSLGISVLLSTLPALLIGPWAGALADRFPPRRIVLIAESTHLVLALLLALVVWKGLPVGAIYALTALSGLVGTFGGPALGRFASQVVPRNDLGNALAWNSIVNSIGRVLGMSLAGVLVAVASEPLLFLVNAATFVAVIVTVLVMRAGEFYPIAVSDPELAGVRAGLTYVRGQRALLLLFALGFVLSSLGRNYQVTMAAMAEGPLGAGAAGYGVLSSVFAVGTVVGGVVTARFRELTIPLLLGAAAFTSVLQAISGFLPNLVGFAAMILPIAAGAVLIDTAKSTRLQLDSDEGMRGRVLAVQGTVAAAAGAVGAPLLGWLAERFGPPQALLVAGLTTLVATAAAAAAFRSGRQQAAEPVAATPVPATAGS
ncbi:sugar phosphate permease [Saccharomonospora marina XMU15]|uniref:Sugar phosphate permease n=1 Tax=Saccharomonospora marina XMU15 TaxID=882083 RepID=H5WZN3_9PSEU|nr:MFS transporter [Saccharomonospora marina]EHR50765.1 sugar phosphate permease [Saccharomonospora marina XMU15]